MTTDADSELVHASCVVIGGRGVLITGRSGSGKSDLALRLIDRGAALVADDYSRIARRGDALWASAPPQIAGRIEVRGVGIVAHIAVAEAPVALLIDLDAPVERLPEPGMRRIAGVELPTWPLAALQASAPIKVELLLAAVPA